MNVGQGLDGIRRDARTGLGTTTCKTRKESRLFASKKAKALSNAEAEMNIARTCVSRCKRTSWRVVPGRKRCSCRDELEPRSLCTFPAGRCCWQPPRGTSSGYFAWWPANHSTPHTANAVIRQSDSLSPKVEKLGPVGSSFNDGAQLICMTLNESPMFSMASS